MVVARVTFQVRALRKVTRRCPVRRKAPLSTACDHGRLALRLVGTGNREPRFPFDANQKSGGSALRDAQPGMSRERAEIVRGEPSSSLLLREIASGTLWRDQRGADREASPPVPTHAHHDELAQRIFSKAGCRKRRTALEELLVSDHLASSQGEDVEHLVLDLYVRSLDFAVLAV
jgi:hypothetical protein